MCGEHSALYRDEPWSPGSSPHVRGTPQFVGGDGAKPGIIPACAGNTEPVASVVGMTRDHPRMCGEHTVNGQQTKLTEGSSPHVRGTRQEDRRGAAQGGIIPACAGNTPCWLRSIRVFRDHPRMCGEHTVNGQQTKLTEGSSPHVRGTLALTRSSP